MGVPRTTRSPLDSRGCSSDAGRPFRAIDRQGGVVNFRLVRINDRRRFHPDGAPREGAAPEAEVPVAAPAEAAAVSPSELEALRAELAAARARVNELARGLQDSARDKDAYRERLARE